MEYTTWMSTKLSETYDNFTENHKTSSKKNNDAHIINHTNSSNFVNINTYRYLLTTYDTQSLIDELTSRGYKVNLYSYKTFNKYNKNDFFDFLI